jgi:choline-sulfatase
VEWFDIGPTLAALAGGEPVHQQFARSLCPALADPGVQVRDCAISELQGEMMIFDGDWKMAVNGKAQPYLLFNIAEDPDEQRNLAGNPDTAQVENELRSRMFGHVLANQVRMEQA